MPSTAPMAALSTGPPWELLVPAELRLLLDCARHGSSNVAEPAGWQRAKASLKDPLDWQYFLALTSHHRLASLTHRALGSLPAIEAGLVPKPVLQELKAAATRNAYSTMQWLAETDRLRGLLASAGVACRVLKGVPLSQQVYGDPALREVGDIDLLIAPGQEEAADDVLLADGYLRNDPIAPLTPRRRLSWRRHGKDYTYRSERSPFEVDLHWRLFRNPYMPGNGLDQPLSEASEPLLLGSVMMRVLPLERNLLYLCVHGALDGWFRFKSLVDVAAIWRSLDAQQRSRVIELAREHEVLPEVAAALRLGLALGLTDVEALSPALQLQAETRDARWIFDYARVQHSLHGWQPTQDAAGTLALKRYEFGLRRGLRFRLEIASRVLLRPRVWARYDLPDALFPLYAVLSPIEWAVFHRTVAPAAVARRQRSPWRRLLRLPLKKQLLLAEALVCMLGARAALRLLPMRSILRWLERPLSHAREDEAMAQMVRWGVVSGARYSPLRLVCFPQALAAYAMLRRRSIASRLHYGVRRAADGRLRAHTWLEVDGRMLLGGESAPLFERVRLGQRHN